ELCPRYYESLALLSKYTGLTKIPSERSASLDRKWKPFESVIAEEEPVASFSGRQEDPDDYRKLDWLARFCPEVCYEQFGYCASKLEAYLDDIDRDLDRQA